MLVDFEGEPARSLEDRRVKKTPLRDVAGMVRSFDYAAAAATRLLGDADPEIREHVEPHALNWRDLASTAYLERYFACMEGSSILPDDEASTQQLLNLLILEKALYEICYEAANRPAWLSIPLNGVLALMENWRATPAKT